MAFELSDFQAKLKGGAARPTLFLASLANPSGIPGITFDDTTSFFIKAAQIPASTIPELIVPFMGKELKIAGDRTFEPWTITIINDIDFTARSLLEEWMAGIAHHNATAGTTGDISGYGAQLSVKHYKDSEETPSAEYQFIGAWPSQLDAIELGWDNKDAVEEYGCTFSYQYWKKITPKPGANLDK